MRIYQRPSNERAIYSAVLGGLSLCLVACQGDIAALHDSSYCVDVAEIDGDPEVAFANVEDRLESIGWRVKYDGRGKLGGRTNCVTKTVHVDGGAPSYLLAMNLEHEWAHVEQVRDVGCAKFLRGYLCCDRQRLVYETQAQHCKVFVAYAVRGDRNTAEFHGLQFLRDAENEYSVRYNRRWFAAAESAILDTVDDFYAGIER